MSEGATAVKKSLTLHPALIWSGGEGSELSLLLLVTRGPDSVTLIGEGRLREAPSVGLPVEPLPCMSLRPEEQGRPVMVIRRNPPTRSSSGGRTYARGAT